MTKNTAKKELMKNKVPLSPFLASLKLILKSSGAVTIEKILFILSEHGHPALLLIFTLPLCFPVQIPGMSTPFGLLLALIGIQMGFTKYLWLPNWILQKKIPKKMLHKVIRKIIIISLFLRKFLKPRLRVLTKNRTSLKFNGVLIFILSLILALPIPVPMINLVSALPILCISIGLLKDDGICVLAGYFLAALCFLFYAWLVHLGFAGIKHLL